MDHDYRITFTLTEEQQARLMALTIRYNRALGVHADMGITAEGLLSSLLTAGFASLIDERMRGVSATLDAMEQRGGCQECQV